MITQFQSAAEGVGSRVERFVNPDAALSYLTTQYVGPIAITPLPSVLQNGLARMGLAEPCDYPDTDLCVSFAEAGIAATGSLLLALTDPVARSATALAPVHAVFLRASTIVSNLGDLKDRLERSFSGSDKAYFSITTGPSRTADIERVLTIGVHGPKELLILVLENE